MTYEKDWTVHPGEVLRETIEERGMTVTEFARRAGLSRTHVSQIIRGKAGYSAQAAVAFERVTGVSAALWTRLLANYRVDIAKGRQDFTIR